MARRVVKPEYFVGDKLLDEIMTRLPPVSAKPKESA